MILFKCSTNRFISFEVTGLLEPIPWSDGVVHPECLVCRAKTHLDTGGAFGVTIEPLVTPKATNGGFELGPCCCVMRVLTTTPLCSYSMLHT